MDNILVTGLGLTKGLFIYPIFPPEVNLELDTEINDKIINYLKNGYFVFGYVGNCSDNEGDNLGYYTFHTDGLWVWPDYYRVFLEKRKTNKIDKTFLYHIFKNNFVMPNLSKDRLQEIKKEVNTEDFIEFKLENYEECTDQEIKKQRQFLYEKDEAEMKIRENDEILRRKEERRKKKGLL